MTCRKYNLFSIAIVFAVLLLRLRRACSRPRSHPRQQFIDAVDRIYFAVAKNSSIFNFDTFRALRRSSGGSDDMCRSICAASRSDDCPNGLRFNLARRARAFSFTAIDTHPHTRGQCNRDCAGCAAGMRQPCQRRFGGLLIAFWLRRSDRRISQIIACQARCTEFMLSTRIRAERLDLANSIIRSHIIEQPCASSVCVSRKFSLRPVLRALNRCGTV
jgi:hypothetical protein